KREEERLAAIEAEYQAAEAAQRQQVGDDHAAGANGAEPSGEAPEAAAQEAAEQGSDEGAAS
ncbi:MAG TPA: hypothetical protein PJ982_04895, partial [Lacipirellulaceae bacterium]|nr:hypothetical protein [Lacipirellulaceae bacterium]